MWASLSTIFALVVLELGSCFFVQAILVQDALILCFPPWLGWQVCHHAQLFSVEMGFCKLFCPGWPWTVILSISVSQVARITGESHQCLVVIWFWKRTSSTNICQLWPKTTKLPLLSCYFAILWRERKGLWSGYWVNREVTGPFWNSVSSSSKWDTVVGWISESIGGHVRAAYERWTHAGLSEPVNMEVLIWFSTLQAVMV
jgi:hypothetical protein